jgi:hypothetical protein
MKINFIDFYSTMTADECIPCSLEDFEELQHVLSEARQRLEDEEELGLCLVLKYTDGELFISAPDYFDDDSLPENVCSAIGRLLRLSGKEFLECEYSQTASRIAVNSHGGGVFRIYNDGTLVRPEIVWPN